MKHVKSICTRYIVLLAVSLVCYSGMAQSSVNSTLIDQYDNPVPGAAVEVFPSGASTVTDSVGYFKLQAAPGDSIRVSKEGYGTVTFVAGDNTPAPILKKDFGWKDLLNPLFYIKNGGLWLMLFIVFAETGLMVGFFLPGDSLLFVAGIFSKQLFDTVLKGGTGSDFIDLILLWILISICGILGNMVGYWFGRKSGPFLFTRRDTFLFKRKHLLRAKDFYDKHGGQAIVFARFLPIVRTFAPIVAGIVSMNRKKFMYYNVIGCLAWVLSMLFAGHYLYKLFLDKFDLDLKKHLEMIVIGIILITTLPVIYKLFFGKRVDNDSEISSKNA
jgi:membrane-associated protein